MVEAITQRGIGSPPKHLSAAAQQAWDDIVRATPPNVLIPLDRAFLEVTAISLAHYRVDGWPTKHATKSALRQFFITGRAAERLMNFPDVGKKAAQESAGSI
jgi:hypothetical protein